MATRAEALSFLQSNYNLNQINNDLYKIEIEYETGRSQLVFVTVNDDFMMFKSPFAKGDDITAKQALEGAGAGGFGVQLVADLYCLAHLVFNADLDASEITYGLGVLASAADDLENELVGGDRL